MAYARSGGKNRGALYRALAQPRERLMPSSQPREVDRPIANGPAQGQAHDVPASLAHGLLYPGTSWGGTHETSGLGWGTKTAADMMADPGTIVGAPESGTVVYFHPTGAQGGGSMLFKGDSGAQYWLGHIANGLPPGTRVKRKQRVALVSSDHAAPHLHIDKR